MDKAGVIDFEKNRGDIELREPAERLFPYVEGITTNEKTSGTTDGPAAGTNPDASDDSRPNSRPDGHTQLGSDSRSTPAKTVAWDLLSLIVGGVVIAKLLGVPGVRRIPDSWVATAAAAGLIANNVAERVK